MLDEGVVQAVQDIDLCMLLGAGWPFWLGGISAYLDRTGVSEAVTGERFLPRGRGLAARLTPLEPHGPRSSPRGRAGRRRRRAVELGLSPSGTTRRSPAGSSGR